MMANSNAEIPVPLPYPFDNWGMVQVANAMEGAATCSFQVSSSASAALVVHRTTLLTSSMLSTTAHFIEKSADEAQFSTASSGMNRGHSTPVGLHLH